MNGEVYISPNTAGKNTFQLTTNASNDARLKMLSDTTTKVDIQANGASYFNGGNVGIGTASPLSEFHVKGDADTIARIEPNNNSGKGTLLVSSAASGDGGMQYDSNANRMYLFSYGDMSFNVGTGNLSGNYPANERLRILSGGGVTFNGDTAAANALDDYEEGTWTPAFYTTSGVTTSSITRTLATYTKIGNIVHIHANLTATLSSLPGQTVTITGLPFAAAGSDQFGIIAVGGHTVNTGANTPKAHFRTNGSQLDGIAYNASSNTAFWTYSSMDAQPFEMSIHGFYTTT